MKTLYQAIVDRKCRTGKAKGTTSYGAYWLACDPIEIRQFGGDGIGNSGASVTMYLLLRHYRSGLVQASIHRDAWHQNGSHSGGGDAWETLDKVSDGQRADGFLGVTTVEDAIVALKKYRFGEGDYSQAVYSDGCEEELTKALVSLGLPESAPAPDESHIG